MKRVHNQVLRLVIFHREPKLDPQQTVREAVEEAVSEVKNALTRLDEVYALYADPDADFDKLAAEQANLEAIIQAHDGHNLDNQLERAADALRLPDWDAKIEHLSGGERRRVALCRLLLEKPDMLLLDEPTNHLDAESVAWLERFLHDYEGTVVAITHDRYFLDNVAGWILELDRGEGIPWEGNYSSWLEQKEKRLEQEQAAENARQKSIAKELEWVRQNPKGRQAKSKARMARFDELNSGEYQKRNETNELFIPPGPRLGDKVIEVEHLTKSYGDRTLIDDLSFSIPKGAIVGIIGPMVRVNRPYSVCFQAKNNPIADQLQWVKLLYLLLWINSVIQWMTRKPFGKKCLTDKMFLLLVTLKFQAVPMLGVSTSKA